MIGNSYFRPMILPGISNRLTPYLQALLCVAFSLVGMLFSHLAFKGASFEFTAAFCGIVFFSVMNSLISVFHESFVKYTFPSWISFFVMVIVLLLLARVISGVSIWTLSEYRMMLGSIVVFYIVTSLLVRLIRSIWEFAEEDEG